MKIDEVDAQISHVFESRQYVGLDDVSSKTIYIANHFNRGLACACKNLHNIAEQSLFHIQRPDKFGLHFSLSQVINVNCIERIPDYLDWTYPCTNL